VVKRGQSPCEPQKCVHETAGGTRMPLALRLFFDISAWRLYMSHEVGICSELRGLIPSSSCDLRPTTSGVAGEAALVAIMRLTILPGASALATYGGTLRRLAFPPCLPHRFGLVVDEGFGVQALAGVGEGLCVLGDGVTGGVELEVDEFPLVG